MNFIGAFEIPGDIVTPMELEAARRLQEETAAKEERSRELEQVRNEKRKQEAREFTARKTAGLLTPEEAEADRLRLEHSRAWQKQWREKRAAEMPPKPPKPLSMKEIVARKAADLPLTPEEIERLEAYRARKNKQFKAWREKQKQKPKPPKVKKPTKKEVISGIIGRKKTGLPLTQEEQETYAAYRQTCNEKCKIWRDSEAVGSPHEPNIADIKKRKRDGLPLSPEETAFFDSWNTKKNELRREAYRSKKGDGLPVAVNQ